MASAGLWPAHRCRAPDGSAGRWPAHECGAHDGRLGTDGGQGTARDEPSAPVLNRRTRWGFALAALLVPAFALANEALPEGKAVEAARPAEARPAETGKTEAAKAEAPKKAAPKEENAPPPPSLSLHALCEELSRSATQREEALQKLAKEREALKKERAELEKLAKEVADAREQLKAETDRLVSFVELSEEAVKPGGDKFWSTRVAAVNASGGKSFDGLAKTLKSMRPDQAAAMVAKLDRTLAAAVLERLRPAESSPILDKLKPEVAADLFGMMATSNAKEAKR